MVKLKDIIAALPSVVYWMNGANCPTVIPSNHIYKVMSVANSLIEDAHYPKVIIPIDGGAVSREPNHIRIKEVRFDFIFVVKKTTGFNREPEDQVQDLIDDFEASVTANDTLGGLVDSLEIEDWTTDSGFAFPEGVVVFKVKVEYRGR